MNGLSDWFHTPPGRYALAWEQAQFDAALVDAFGYHAVQLGLPALDALAANRMPHRWYAELRDSDPQAVHPDDAASVPPSPAQQASGTAYAPQPVVWQPALATDSRALPFAEASVDLVVLPHTLEFSPDPHATLREVQRVLVHEGRVAISGLNPASLWGWRQYRAHVYRSLGSGSLYLPDGCEFIGHWRLRDWLRLLEFELESVAFGCYRPAVRSAGSLARFEWMDRLGARWWPVLGAAYVIVAVKRTRGAMLMGASWRKAPVASGAPVSVAGRATPAAAVSQNDLESN